MAVISPFTGAQLVIQVIASEFESIEAQISTRLFPYIANTCVKRRLLTYVAHLPEHYRKLMNVL